MPLWPFRRRRRGSAADAQSRELLSETKGVGKAYIAPATVTSQRQAAPPSTISRTAASSPPPSAPRTISRPDSHGNARRPAGSQRAPKSSHSQQWRDSEKAQSSSYKENVPPLRSGSREDITALPVSYKLEQSPHLRPVDIARPQIPYNFGSQPSILRADSSARPPKPQTLHSKRSAVESGMPARRASSRLSKKPRDDAARVREEEIRALSAPIPIPKRHGDGPLRRESKKVRNAAGRESTVSLPPEGSIHSSMSGVMEQRGWEIGGLTIFNPRPSVRLSSTPQYVVSTSLPQGPSGVLYRIDSIRGSDKQPESPEPARKLRTIGDEVDELGASDIRTLMDRDAKRREKRQQERQEKLERKLKDRQGRNRGDSDARRLRAEQQIQAHGPRTPPTEVHPALRTRPAETDTELVGLGIGAAAAGAGVASAGPMEVDNQVQQLDEDIMEEQSQDPFTDAEETLQTNFDAGQRPASSATTLPLESALEEPVVETAHTVTLTQTQTPPLSPTKREPLTSSHAKLAEAIRQESVSAEDGSDLQPPPRIPVEQRGSDPPQQRRSGAWTSFFRRGGSNILKNRREEAASPSEKSFSNTSRESMRNQPLPAHLVSTAEPRPSAPRSVSGTLGRTQSKFREDLPDMAVLPEASRTQSPEIGGVIAAVRRNETPLSQSMRGHTAMAGSLASIDSEAEWLASGSSKRQSNQSALSRSLSKRNEFNGSYEELGGDGDADYMTRNRSRKASNPALIGASPDEESEEDSEVAVESSATPVAVHGNVRRRPTLVQHDPRLKSREGLVGEFAAAERAEPSESGERVETPFETPFETPNESPERGFSTGDDVDTDEDTESPPADATIERATSVQYGSRHSRQFSAGSAILLDVAAKRASMAGRDSMTATPEPPSTAGASNND